MTKGSLIGLVTLVVLGTTGCGDDDGSGGAGGGGATTTTSASTNSGGTTSSSTTSSSATSSSTGSGAGSTSATTSTTSGSTTAATGGGMAGFAEPCMSNADCESDVCHNFPNNGGMLCTLVCDGPEDCPAPSSGCNNMGYCKPN